MKLLSLMLCLLAVTANSVMGVCGAWALCQHESGEVHLLEQGLECDHLDEGSCESADTFASLIALDDCGDCIDTEFGGDETLDATPTGGNYRAAAPEMVATEPMRFGIAPPPACAAFTGLRLSRAPPQHGDPVRLQIEKTVIRV